MVVRTRFSPSPSGALHLGSARTALFAWLYARRHRGQFILRIEDTDKERSSQESVDAILEAMDWLGLDYDEGPFYQSQRFERYHEVIEKLLSEDKAYRCYCSKERLDALREKQQEKKLKPRYDGHCRDIKQPPSDQSFVVRFRNPHDGDVVFQDQVYGEIRVRNVEMDDLIIARSSGSPTYNFTVVVDDVDMNISHVIRGDDHINNTPRQINILKALGADIPIYAHLPMILDERGKRLSKREGAANVMNYRDEGYLPEALLNYLVRLGWSRGDQEVFSIDEMIKHFDTANINKSPAALNSQKLLWLNQHYLKHKPSREIAEVVVWHLQRLGIESCEKPPLHKVVRVQVERSKTALEIAEKSVFFYRDLTDEENRFIAEKLDPEIIPALEVVMSQLQTLGEWSGEAIHQVIEETAEMFELKMGKLAQLIKSKKI